MARYSRCLTGLGIVAGLSCLAGCEKPPAPASKPTGTGVATTSSEREALKSAVAGKPETPATNRAVVPDARNPHGAPSLPATAGEGPPPSTIALKFTPPSDWKSVKPSSAMRTAQFSLPAAEGDTVDGELVVFDSRSLGGGGDIESNLNRWREMMTGADGGRVSDEAVKRETIESDGIKTVIIDISGRYAPSQMPGAPASKPLDSARMLAAVVELGNERHYIRATGPMATMTKHYDAFRAYVTSAKK